MQASELVGYLGGESTGGDGPPPGDGDPEQRLALPGHGRPVLVPVRVLAADRAVVLDQGLQRLGQIQHLGLAVHLHPRAVPVLGQHAQRDGGVPTDVGDLRPLRIGRDDDPSVAIHPAGQRRHLHAAFASPGHEDRLVARTEELQQGVPVDPVGRRDLRHTGTLRRNGDDRFRRSGACGCVEIVAMRLRLPGRSPGTPAAAPADPAGSSPAAAPGATAEPGADVTAAPAPTEGRGPKLQRASRKLAIASAQFLLIAAAVVVLFWVLGKLWSILLPIVLGLLIATVLWPATRFLRKHRWPPALAAATVLLAAVAVFVGVIAALAPSVADQVTELSDQATRALQDVQEWLQGPPFDLGEDQIGNAVDSVINSIQDNAQNIAGYALTG